MRKTVKDDISRRAALKAGAGALGAIIAAPMINIGRFRLFAGSNVEYTARCLTLMQESVVIDGLGPLTIDDRWVAWSQNPETFTEEIFQKYKSSGINVFHHAFGLGGPTAYDQAISYFGMVNALIAGADQYMMRIDSAGDFARVKASGKIAILPGLQNSEHFRRPQEIAFFHG